MSHRLSGRLARIEREAPPPPADDSAEARLAYCREHGLPEHTVLVGFPGPFVICLPAEETEGTGP